VRSLLPDADELEATTRVTALEREAELPAAQAWPGTARYEVVCLLGEGGMGAVYEVFDREAQRAVALKTLRRADPASIYRFKQEFRTLADVVHPNLVHLYEFVATESGDVFFTMELVRGTHFVQYVRDAGNTLNIDRLRAALRQLAEGVAALHSAGKLHRDIKPSNVLVTPEGRVVVLDFGVAAELPTMPGGASFDGEVVGTASFMAPEHSLSGARDPACDWYSVGVMLYVALVGFLPFAGPATKVLAQKISCDPIAPRERAKHIPPDLDSLCMSLLARDPGMRPTGAEILRRLGASRDSLMDLTRARAGAATALIGRESHLRMLGAALDATDGGGVVAVFAAGLPGVGKSALMRQFLDDRMACGDAIVLRGRAYERESVPFKAIDAVIDALSLHLVRRAREGRPVALPEDVSVAAKVFPVLGRVPGIEGAPDDAVLEPIGLRRRAFSALRELLAATAAGGRLIIYIDDVQWGDADSAALLLELLRPRRALSLLLVVSYRDNEARNSTFLGELTARMPESVDVRKLKVGPLSSEDAERLALVLLGAEERARAVARSVARESCGNPFLVEELSSSLSAPGRAGLPEGRVDLSDVTLEQMVDERACGLPDDARRLLEVIAVEGRPVSVSIAAAAAGVGERVDDAVSLLRVNRFVREGLRNGHEVLEMSHDRIRETVTAALSQDATRARHAALARVFESLADANPEIIAVHLFGAGESERGAQFAEAAAEQAAAKLAFDRAALLFQAAAATVPASSPNGRRLRVRLARVLEWAGRGTEAARVYEEVARVAPAGERTQLERAAAEQLLTCGRIDEGAAVLHRVLSDVHLGAPRTAASALLWLLLYTLWLRLRGLGFRARSADELLERERLRLDALFTVALGFGSVDVVLSACMTAWSLVAALRAGERAAIRRAASLQMSLASARGGVETKHERALEQLAGRLVEEEPTPEATAFYRSNVGISHYCRGRWMQAVRELDSALLAFPANRAGMTSNVHVFCVCSLVYAGKIRELRQRLPRLIADAADRGDLFMLAHLRASHPIVAWLAADDVDDARRHAKAGMARWPRLRFVIQHWQAMLAEAQIALYADDGAGAYERVARDLPALRRSLLLHAQIISGVTHFVQGRAALASLESVPALREKRLEEATKMSRALARHRMPWTDLFSSMLEAAIANARGDSTTAATFLRVSLTNAKLADMSMHGAAAAHRLGSLLGGHEGAEYVAEASSAMNAEEIRSPVRWAAMLLPGRWGRD
jgi:tetratricopeptide (TPR) repeat protein